METLQEFVEKCKQFLRNDAIFVPLLIVLIGLSSFALGRLSAIEKPEVKISMPAGTPNTEQAGAVLVASPGEKASISGSSEVSHTGAYVASKNGSVYHLPWCPGAARIKEENKVWFPSKEAAEKAGYRPAGNCKGI